MKRKREIEAAIARWEVHLDNADTDEARRIHQARIDVLKWVLE